MCIIHYNVLRILSSYHPKCTKLIDEDYTYEDISILTSSLDKTPKANKLYISLSPDFSLFNQFSQKITIICPARDESFARFKAFPCAVIALADSSDMADVINRLTNYTNMISSWKSALNLAVATDSDLQSLLDISEPYFHDPIIIMSKTLKVLACTKHIPASHPDVEKTIRDGYFSRHMIKGLIENNYLQAAESFREIGYHYPPNYIGCTKIIKVFGENTLHAHTICLYGLSSDPTPETMYRMKILVNAIQELLHLHYPAKGISDNRDSCIFEELIEDDLPPDELENKSNLLNWKPQDSYCIYCIKFKRYFYPYVLFIINCLQSVPLFTNVFAVNQQIIVLEKMTRHLEINEKKQNQNIWLESLLKENSAYCGQSSPFNHLSEFRQAYLQASAAASIGNLLNPSQTMYQYKDYFVYHVLCICGKQVSLDKLYCKQLKEIKKYDNKHTTNDIQLLCSLLKHERNVTAVAKDLFLHRNTVIYRIKKLEERLGLSLDDPNVRLMLQLSIMMLDLCNNTAKSQDFVETNVLTQKMP